MGFKGLHSKKASIHSTWAYGLHFKATLHACWCCVSRSRNSMKWGLWPLWEAQSIVSLFFSSVFTKRTRSFKRTCKLGTVNSHQASLIHLLCLLSSGGSDSSSFSVSMRSSNVVLLPFTSLSCLLWTKQRFQRTSGKCKKTQAKLPPPFYTARDGLT